MSECLDHLRKMQEFGETIPREPTKWRPWNFLIHWTRDSMYAELQRMALMYPYVCK